MSIAWMSRLMATMTLRLGHLNVRYVSPLNQSEMYSYVIMPYLRVYRKMEFYAYDVKV